MQIFPHHPDEIVTYILNKEPYLLLRLNEKYNYGAREAEEGLVECARYLTLVSHYNEQLTPSITVDDIWHELILFTRLYFDVCENYLDRYIHHRPGGTKEENNKQFIRTLKLYNLNFGEPNYKYWNTQNAMCGVCEGK